MNRYLVRYDEYGNEKLLSAVSLRSVEAPPEVADIVVKDMKYGVGATIEAQYAEDGEWYVAQIKAHTPEGNYFVTFVEYGNFQEVRLCIFFFFFFAFSLFALLLSVLLLKFAI